MNPDDGTTVNVCTDFRRHDFKCHSRICGVFEIDVRFTTKSEAERVENRAEKYSTF